MLTPHAPGMEAGWLDDGVEVYSFRYAPGRAEVLGYSRSLSSDETIRFGAAAVTPFYAFAARQAVKRLLDQRRFDLLQAHWLVPNGLVAGTVAGQVPLVIGLHGSDVFLAERPLVRGLVRGSLKRCRGLTGCSPELVERVCALGFPVERAVVIPYGVDTDLFAPTEEQVEPWRQKLGIPDTAVVALGVGRMVTKKGFHVLLEVLPKALQKEPSLHVVLAGGGDRLEEFRRQASPWQERIHFPGVVLRDTLPDLYRAADLFVLPAVHDSKGNVDGLPNVILEAMASGLPVIASEISGIPLAVTHGQEGLLVGEGRRDELLEALLRLAESPSARRRLGVVARRKAETELTWRAVAGRYREAYKRALSRPAADTVTS